MSGMAKKNNADIVIIKQEVNEEGKDYGLALNARDRLKGALEQQLVHSDSSDAEEFKTHIQLIKRESNKENTPRKKKLKINSAAKDTTKCTYVMKLFDRSVDLAQFEESTPLYPICRAWMTNVPKSNINMNLEARNEKELKQKEDETREESELKSEDEGIKDVLSLPSAATQTEKLVWPVPPKKIEDFSLDYDKPLPSKEILLASHIAHWGQVKKTIKTMCFKREEIFQASRVTLRHMYHAAN